MSYSRRHYYHAQMIGYARYSPLDKNPIPQLEELSLDKVFVDHVSVNDLTIPLFKSLLEGDTLVVQSMDRIAGNMEDLRQILRNLTSRGIKVKFVKEDLIFSREGSHLATQLLSVIDAMAEFEKSLRRERQIEGIAKAKAKGRYKGRKKSLTPEQITELKKRLSAGESKGDLAKAFNIGRGTLYRYAKTA